VMMGHLAMALLALLLWFDDDSFINIIGIFFVVCAKCLCVSVTGTSVGFSHLDDLLNFRSRKFGEDVG
jgi:hypothetical protein